MKGVSGDVIILEEAAYCDPGLVAEVYAVRTHPSIRMRLTRPALCVQGRTAFEHAKQCFALHFNAFRQRKPYTPRFNKRSVTQLNDRACLNAQITPR